MLRRDTSGLAPSILRLQRSCAAAASRATSLRRATARCGRPAATGWPDAPRFRHGHGRGLRQGLGHLLERRDVLAQSLAKLDGPPRDVAGLARRFEAQRSSGAPWNRDAERAAPGTDDDSPRSGTIRPERGWFSSRSTAWTIWSMIRSAYSTESRAM